MRHRLTGLCAALVLCTVPMRPQTLAHPGWRGNGITPQAWWKHASFVRMSPDTTFAEAAHTLDAMSEAGVDSMILPDLQPAADSTMPFQERFGTEEDLDALLREASARHVHVLIAVPVARLSAGGAEVRFWMSRGIAGMDAGSVSAGDVSVLRGVRSAMTQFPGDRILLAHTATPAMAKTSERRLDPVTFHLVPAGGGEPQAAAASSAMEVTDVASLPAFSSSGMVPVFAERLLQQAEDRSRIHTALVQRARTASHGRAGQRS